MSNLLDRDSKQEIAGQAPGYVAKKPTQNWIVCAEIGCALWLYYVLVVIAIALPPFIVPVFGLHLNLRQGTAVTLGGTLLVELVVVVVLRWWMKRRKLGFRDIGFVKPSSIVALIAACLFALMYAGWTLLIPQVRVHAGELGLFKFWGVAVSIVAAVVEETVFRGWIMNELARAGRSKALQVAVSAATFALLHVGFGLWGLACTLVMGAVLALTYIWNGRSLAAPIAAHCLVNLIIEPWLLLYLITFYAQKFGSG